MLARAVDGTKVSLLEDMLRLIRETRGKLGRMVREVLDKSSLSRPNCNPSNRENTAINKSRSLLKV